MVIGFTEPSLALLSENSIFELARVTAELLPKSLRNTLRILVNYNLEGLTMSNAALHMYRLGIPLSTAKYALRKLRDYGLIECGSESSRGVELKITWIGRLLAEMMNDDMET